MTLTETLLVHLPIPASRLLLGVDNKSNPHHKKDLLQKLNHLRRKFKCELKLRGQMVWNEMILYVRAAGYEVPPRPSDKAWDKDYIRDLDSEPFLASQIASVIRSSSPSFLAEIREWQRVWHMFWFILYTMKCLRTFMRQPLAKFPIYGEMCDAMAATAFAFPPPRGTLPVEQRADDSDRIMDRYTCFNEPKMLDFFSSLSDIKQKRLNTQLEIVHNSLPVFPSSFNIWDTLPGHNMSVRRVLGQDKKKAARLRCKIYRFLPKAYQEHMYEML